MKKALAVFLAVIMLFSVSTICSSAAEETPKVSIVTNQGSPVVEDTETYFTVRFDDFQPIKGVDVTITAGGDTVLGKVTSYNFKEDAEKDVNYTETANTIRFVDLLANGAQNARLVFAAYAPSETATITVTGKYAKSGTTLFEIDSAEGVFEIKAEVPKTPIADNTTKLDPPALSTNTFIPVGGVYKETTVNDKTNYIFAEKNQDGSFTLPGDGFVYQTYEIPENGITTFGLSNDVDHPELLRFGNFSNLNDAYTSHGTMVFEGDWLALKNYYIQRGYTVKDFVKVLYNNAFTILNSDENLSKPEGERATHVYYELPGVEDPIKLFLFKQKNYMWKDEDEGILEYTIRLHGVKENTMYAGIAYSVDKTGAVTISENVKSIGYKATDAS